MFIKLVPGLGKFTEICQIGGLTDTEQFSVYVLPRFEVSTGASAVNHLTKFNDELYFRGARVASSSPEEGLKSFTEWTLSTKTSVDDKVVLVAHNAFGFDAPVLINNLLKSGFHCGFVDGFVDTVEAFRLGFPGLESYSLRSLKERLQ